MRDRKKQRELRRNRKDKFEKPWQNAEGYTDLTAYHGINNATKKPHQNPEGRFTSLR